MKPGRDGYVRTRRNGRPCLVHRWVWEEHNGPIPSGFHVHHRNGDKTDNRIDNLELVSTVDHKRIHSPHYRRDSDDAWERQCSTCSEWKSATADHWYLSREGWVLYGWCRLCHLTRMAEVRQRHRQRAA